MRRCSSYDRPLRFLLVVQLGLSLVALAALSAVAGCNDQASCVEVSAEAIDLEDGTLESISAAALLQNEGRYEASLTWLGAEISDEVELHPPTGTTGLEVELRRGGGQTRYVRYERVGGHPHERLACSNVIELGVQLRLLSGDGALDGTWDMVVSEPETGGSRVSVVVDPTGPENHGDFAARLITPHTWEAGSPQVELTSVFDMDIVQGHIEIRARPQGADDQRVSLRATAARWTGVRIDD